jgi:hypothetical protein
MRTVRLTLTPGLTKAESVSYGRYPIESGRLPNKVILYKISNERLDQPD